MNVCGCGELVERYREGTNKLFREKSVSVPCFSLQIPHSPDWDRYRASAVWGWRIRARGWRCLITAPWGMYLDMNSSYRERSAWPLVQLTEHLVILPVRLWWVTHADGIGLKYVLSSVLYIRKVRLIWKYIGKEDNNIKMNCNGTRVEDLDWSTLIVAL